MDRCARVAQSAGMSIFDLQIENRQMRTGVVLTPMKPQDIVVLLGIVARGSGSWKAKDLATDLFISQAEVGYSIKRSIASGLLSEDKQVMSQGLLDMLRYGVRYMFPARPGPLVRGMLTAYSAPPLNRSIRSSEPVVWPDALGTARGVSITPLYPTVPKAAQRNAELYALLALTDTLRFGRARERERAWKELKAGLG